MGKNRRASVTRAPGRPGPRGRSFRWSCHSPSGRGHAMKPVRLLLSTLVALSWAVQLAAQGETGAIAGQVTDSLTQRPLVGVEVSVAGMTRKAVSDQEGRYSLAGVPVGPQIVQTALIGYGQQRKAVDVTSGGVATIDFA